LFEVLTKKGRTENNGLTPKEPCILTSKLGLLGGELKKRERTIRICRKSFLAQKKN